MQICTTYINWCLATGCSGEIFMMSFDGKETEDMFVISNQVIVKLDDERGVE